MTGHHAGQALATVRSQKVEIRPEWNNAGRIDRLVALIVMLLDMLEIGRPCDTGMLIELAGESPEIGVVHDAAQVAFEVSDIDSVESHQCREQPPIGLGKTPAAEIPCVASRSSNASRVANSGRTASS